MAKLSKKQAKQIASLINSCTCWSICFRDEVAKDNMDLEKAKFARITHDRYADQLNALLGVDAVVKFTQEAK